VRTVSADALERRRGEVVGLTQELVRAPSPNPPGDERAAAEVVARYLDGVPGVSRRILASRPERPNLVFELGAGSPALALAAHLDTHAVTGPWSRDPFGAELVADRVWGLGTTDNKGAVAAMAVVFRAFAEAGAPAGRLLFIANADEETGGQYGIEHLLKEIEPVDAVVVAEPSGIETSWEKLYVAARGTSRFRVTTRGVETHSSLADHPGVDSGIERLEAILAALRVGLPSLSERHPVYGIGPRLIPVRVEGGVGWGVVAPSASVELELRVTPGFSQDRIERELRAAVAAADRDALLEFVEGSLRWMGPSEIDLAHPLVDASRAAWRDVFGRPPELGCFPGGTDARLFTESGMAALAGIGPGALFRAHHPDEYVTLAELDTAVLLYGAIVSRYQEGVKP
jgi:acetylornithine deacetylase/succinyl-diaminopimelate desuccinylase-like protein